MSTASPRPPRHLTTFAAGLGVLVTALAATLFGVRMEAVAPAVGVIEPRDAVEVRARRAGLVDPGWQGGELPAGPTTVAVRLDHRGDGGPDPAGPARAVVRRWATRGPGDDIVSVRAPRPHRLRPGDVLWAGQPLATLRPDETHLWNADHPAAAARSSGLSDPLPAEPVTLTAPDTAGRWLVLDVPVSPGQAVRPGDLLAVLAPLDADTGRPAWLARLDFDEAHFASVAVGQRVRLSGPLYPRRVYGTAEATIERLEPGAVPGPDGGRRFRAWAAVTGNGPDWRAGATVTAEVLVGRKPTWRVILEH
jgi:hypothetical protein